MSAFMTSYQTDGQHSKTMDFRLNVRIKVRVKVAESILGWIWISLATVWRPYVTNVMRGFHRRSSDSGRGETYDYPKLSTGKGILHQILFDFVCEPSFSSGEVFQQTEHGFGHRSNAENRRATVTGSSSVCHHSPQNEGQKNGTRDSVEYPSRAPSLAESCRVRTAPGYDSHQAHDEPRLKPQGQSSTSVSSPRPVPSYSFSSL